MYIKKRILKNSKISDKLTKRVVASFLDGDSAVKASKKIGLGRHSVSNIYKKIRRAIIRESDARKELDVRINKYESPFGYAKRYPLFGMIIVPEGVRIEIIGRINKWPSVLKEVGKEIYSKICPFEAVSINDLFNLKIVSNTSDKKIKKFRDFYYDHTHILYRYRFRDQYVFLKEIEWRFNHVNLTMKKQADALIDILKKYG